MLQLRRHTSIQHVWLDFNKFLFWQKSNVIGELDAGEH
jgi:hypothetical protein